VGDGQWYLYDIKHDPGETKDLKTEMPEVFKVMQADYAAYAKSNDILAMPDGYNPVRQVVINSFVNYWIPAYKTPVLVSLLAMTLAALAVFRLRRRRSAK
jgi:hypothetical protein